MLYRISVTERGLTGIANIFRSRLSRLDDLLGAGTVPLNYLLRARPKAERVHRQLAEIFHIERPGPARPDPTRPDPTVKVKVHYAHKVRNIGRVRPRLRFLRTVLVWLSTCIPYQLNIVSDYAITQYRTNASEVAHLVRIVCSGLNAL